MTEPTLDHLAVAVGAIRQGDVETLTSLLNEHPSLATMQPNDNPRSLLHHATDWPGHWPNVADSIRLLMRHGANVIARFPSDTPIVAETPLHWAASSGDVEAVEALLAAGAPVDILGGLFDGCAPLDEAIIFEKYEAAHALLRHGAQPFLAGAAALGMTKAIGEFFNADGSIDLVRCQRPHQDKPPRAQDVLDRAFQFACRAGHLDAAKMLLGRGADPAAVSPANTTALEWAVQNQQHDVARWINSLSM